uniref:Peptidase_M41 domain-containing protein n=1 Tax=Strongyloides papillosus TaxID=174720 RepID=A0A0N5CI20_STREA
KSELHQKKEEDDNDSDETEEDKLNMKVTEETIKILGKLDAAMSEKKGEENESSSQTQHIIYKSKSSHFFSDRLFQGDILLTRTDAQELIDEAVKRAKESNVNISEIDTIIKTVDINGNLNYQENI